LQHYYIMLPITKAALVCVATLLHHASYYNSCIISLQEPKGG